MVQKIKIQEFVKYKGHSVKANGNIDISLEANYGEITNSMQVLQLLNNDVTIRAKIGDTKFSLGVFRVKNVSFADDGVSTLKFSSESTAVELDNVNLLCDADLNEFAILMLADVELEGEDEKDAG